MALYFNWYVLAQSAGDAAQETAEETKQLLSKITTWKVTQAILIVLLCYVSLRIIDWLIIWVSERIAREWRLQVKQFIPVLRTVALGTTVITLMNLFLNLSRENIIAVTGAAAVALGFAFKDYASSIIAGIVGIFEGSYRVGDRIKIGEDYGEVVRYGLRGIRLQTPSDNTVTVPHSKIWTESISNSNAGELEAQVITEFYFAHEVDTELVTKILYRAAHTSRYTQLELPIVVAMAETPYGTHFKLKSYPLDARDEFTYQTDLTNKAKKAFAKYKLAYPRLLDMEQN
ncbi:mechanosensitive ion channel family protein [Pleurocapsa sp. PCC 7319]|uniref:mechanosensitive ion channel family protein n=1 Tax=Pleurocapsa sp. PCC 7319 TaxID=118161 RepID=UPI00034781A5|nr:mechanosensitive ion channel domain-containing protein [Pleurocapsa sp. PCC 7319]